MQNTNGKARTTLAERARQLSEKFETAKNRLAQLGLENQVLAVKLAPPPMPHSERYTCVVCKMPRLDQDITGLTCGNLACLSALGELWEDHQEVEALRGEMGGIEEQLMEMAAALLPEQEVTNLEKDTEINLIELCKRLAQEVDDIVDVLE